MIARINADLMKVLASTKVLSRMESVGSEVAATSSEQASDALRADAEKRARLVKERNIRFQ